MTVNLLATMANKQLVGTDKRVVYWTNGDLFLGQNNGTIQNFITIQNNTKLKYLDQWLSTFLMLHETF